MKIKVLICCALMLAFYTQNVNAQEEEKKEVRKMTIITKTIDEDGNETVTKTVKEGDEVSDEEIDKIIQKHTGGKMSIDVEVDMEEEGTEKIIIREKGEKGAEKKYRIIKKTQNVEVEGDGDSEIIVIDGDHDDMEKKIKIIKKHKDGDEVEHIIIEGDHKDGHKKIIFITEDGDVQTIDKDVKIIKRKKGDGEEIEIEVITEDGGKNIWIEKEGGEEGDVIVIEIETTEEIDKDGKKKTKTIKKKKKIKKEKY